MWGFKLFIYFFLGVICEIYFVIIRENIKKERSLGFSIGNRI